MARHGPKPDDLRDPSIHAFVAGLPKVELHVHLVGAASPATVLALARRHPDMGVPTDAGALERWLTVADLDGFCAAFGAVCRLLADGADVVALVALLAADLAAANVRYAEVTVTPLAHLAAGIGPGELAEALAAGRARAAREHGVELAWVFDVSGDLGVRAGHATLDWVLRHGPDGTVGFGLGGPERDVPRGRFAEVFAAARAAGLHSAPHAGETDGAGSVWSALVDLGAERVGHGIRSVEDPALVAHLAACGVALEVCPTSNARTGAVAALREHPLPALLTAGVRVTLATDDPGLFRIDLGEEYRRCHDVLGLGREQLVDLAVAGVDAAFCSPALAHRVRREIDAYAAAGRAHRPGQARCCPPGE